MIKEIDRNLRRKGRHLRVRKRVFGTPEMPRLNVYKSINHIYAQIIDDKRQKTLLSASTLSKEIAENIKGKTKSDQAFIVGELIGKMAKKKGIKQVVFDRGGYLYTGRVLKLAEGARKAGLKI